MNEFSRRSEIKFPSLDIDEINERIKLFQEIDKTIPPIIVKKVDKSTFLLNKK